MKDLLRTISVAAIAAICISGHAFAAGNAAAPKTAAPPKAATGTATQTQTITKPTVKVVETVSKIDLADLVSKVKAAYGAADNYELDFDLAIDTPKKNITPLRKKELTNTYNLKVLGGADDPEKYTLRLEGINGFNRHTTVIYAPDDKGVYWYTVFKPALPRGKRLRASNPLMEDVPDTRVTSFISKLETLTKSAAVSLGSEQFPDATFNPKKNEYVFKAIVSASYRGKSYDEKNQVTIDGTTHKLLSWETFYGSVEKKEFMFRSILTWKDYKPGEVTPDQILAAPHFITKEQR